MTQTPTDALRLVPIEMVKAWKKKAENRFMTSSLNEYCPEEFLTLADAYIALAAAPASPLPGGGPTCQLCASKIEGWICQGCGSHFYENDAGALVLNTIPAAPTGDAK